MLADRDEIISALDDVARRASALGLDSTIAVLGGAAIELHIEGRGATRDIDALVYRDRLDPIVHEVAAARGWPADWLNDAVKAFVSDHDDPHTWPVLLAHDRVAVRLAPVEVLIAMKLKAVSAFT
jgi:hypothetical protein